jgi:hypothetical protein
VHVSSFAQTDFFVRSNLYRYLYVYLGFTANSDIAAAVSYDFCSRESFEEILQQFLARKVRRCLVSQALYDEAVQILRNPENITISSKQTRRWVKQRLQLLDMDGTSILFTKNENKKVAIKENLYDIICKCHEELMHVGYDKVHKEVIFCAALKCVVHNYISHHFLHQINYHYDFCPQGLVEMFVKRCTECLRKKTQTRPVAMRPIIVTSFMSHFQVCH